MKIICNEHDVELVRNEVCCWWGCPIGTGYIDDEEVARLSSAMASHLDKYPDPTISIVGCKDRERKAINA